MILTSQRCISVIFRRQMSTKLKVIGVLDDQIQQAIENNELKAKHHPGKIPSKAIELPILLQRSLNNILKDKPITKLIEEGKTLNRYLKARHYPEENNKKQQEENKKLRAYNWKPIDFDEYTCLQYLVGRIEPEYAIIYKILNEINQRIPNFQPLSVFDFGSGVGTVAWVAQTLWKKSLKEIFCVDTSEDMNNLAELILKNGNLDNEFKIPGTYFRQFLPVSKSRKYDLVVSAFSLLELSSTESRLNVIHNLWNKTNKYLVLIEQGTNAAFQIIDEAKEFVLYLNKKSPDLNAYIFSPCPHELPCPRLLNRMNGDKTPCNFEVKYLSTFDKNSYLREKYSYVVIGKGKRPESLNWPRVVRPVITKSKHSICRICTTDGKLQEIIFTAKKDGKALYQCAKNSEWGDILPVTIKTEEKEIRQKLPKEDNNLDLVTE